MEAVQYMMYFCPNAINFLNLRFHRTNLISYDKSFFIVVFVFVAVTAATTAPLSLLLYHHQLLYIYRIDIDSIKTHMKNTHIILNYKTASAIRVEQYICVQHTQRESARLSSYQLLVIQLENNTWNNKSHTRERQSECTTIKQHEDRAQRVWDEEEKTHEENSTYVSTAHWHQRIS